MVLAPFRAYNPYLGRWITRDPIREKGGINLYAYVKNSPISLYDILGFDPISGTGPLRIDDDGYGPSHGDPYHNSHLSGRNANADITPYVVASPEVEAQGVNIGDPAEIHFPNGNIVRCHVMDTGPSGASPGEISAAAAHSGGYSTVDRSRPGRSWPHSNSNRHLLPLRALKHHIHKLSQYNSIANITSG